MSETERAPETPGEFQAPEGVHEVEPTGDDAPAPEADLSGDEIPDNLDDLPDDDDDELLADEPAGQPDDPDGTS